MEHQKKKFFRRIVYTASDLSRLSNTMSRGGSDIINVNYIDCDVELSLNFLNNI